MQAEENKNPKYTKWKITLDILSLIPFIIFIGVGIYDPNIKAHNPDGSLTYFGKLFLINFIPALAGGLWIVFRYIGSDLLLFRLLDKLHLPLSIFIILMMILLSLMTVKG